VNRPIIAAGAPACKASNGRTDSTQCSQPCSLDVGTERVQAVVVRRLPAR